MSLRDRVNMSFGKLLEKHGFREVSYAVDEMYFGNTIFELCSSICIRFVTDRSAFLVDIAPGTHQFEWYPLNFALEIIGYPWAAISGIADESVAAILDKEFLKLVSIFAPENLEDTRARLSELAARPRPRSH